MLTKLSHFICLLGIGLILTCGHGGKGHKHGKKEHHDWRLMVYCWIVKYKENE